MAQGPTRARRAPRTQAATWAWAGKPRPRLGLIRPARAPAAPGRRIQSDGRPPFSRDQNPAGGSHPRNPSCHSALLFLLSQTRAAAADAARRRGTAGAAAGPHATAPPGPAAAPSPVAPSPLSLLCPLLSQSSGRSWRPEEMAAPPPAPSPARALS